MDKILQFTLSQKSIYVKIKNHRPIIFFPQVAIYISLLPFQDYLIKYAHPYFKVFRDLRKELDKYYEDNEIKKGVPNDIEDIYDQIKDKPHVPYKLSLKLIFLI